MKLREPTIHHKHPLHHFWIVVLQDFDKMKVHLQSRSPHGLGADFVHVKDDCETIHTLAKLQGRNDCISRVLSFMIARFFWFWGCFFFFKEKKGKNSSTFFVCSSQSTTVVSHWKILVFSKSSFLVENMMPCSIQRQVHGEWLLWFGSETIAQTRRPKSVCRKQNFHLHIQVTKEFHPYGRAFFVKSTESSCQVFLENLKKHNVLSWF